MTSVTGNLARLRDRHPDHRVVGDGDRECRARRGEDRLRGPRPDRHRHHRRRPAQAHPATRAHKTGKGTQMRKMTKCSLLTIAALAATAGPAVATQPKRVADSVTFTAPLAYYANRCGVPVSFTLSGR